MCLATLGCVLAVLGLVLGAVQFRKTTPFRLSSSIRYTGWMRWHYILGAVFGLFTLTWVFSGLLSMEPFAWTNAEGLTVRAIRSAADRSISPRFRYRRRSTGRPSPDGKRPKEIELRRIEDEPYFLARYTQKHPTAAEPERLHQPYLVSTADAQQRLLVNARTLQARSEPFSVDSLLMRLRAALPDEQVAEQTLLEDYDDYYYSRNRQAPLPVLRVKFADPMRTWIYVDPALGRTVATVHRLSRLERWLYNGLHSLDFAFWYRRRPLWDVGMVILLLGALTATSIGLVFGVRRATRDLSRALTRR